MTAQTMTPSALRRKGLEAMAKSLGPVGMARFLQQIDGGTGDYTRDRDQWLKGLDIKTIAEEARRLRPR